MLSVSAILPCYNGERWLREALDSIGAQTRPVQEIIVANDGSTDRSGEIAASYGAMVIEHGTNRGNGAARNSGIRAATGEVIAWLDVDDTWRPEHVEVVAGLLERNSDAAAAFGALQMFGLENRLVLGYVPASGAAEEVLMEAFRDWLHATSSAIVRRSALLAVGGCDESERYAVDFDLWLRLAREHRFVATDQVTADWRWHETQLSSQSQRQYDAVYRYRRRFLDRLAREGEHELSATLEDEFLAIWLNDLNAALDARDQSTFRAVASRAPLVRGVGRSRRAICAASVHVPIGLVTRVRDLRRTIRTRSRPAPGPA